MFLIFSLFCLLFFLLLRCKWWLTSSLHVGIKIEYLSKVVLITIYFPLCLSSQSMWRRKRKINTSAKFMSGMYIYSTISRLKTHTQKKSMTNMTWMFCQFDLTFVRLLPDSGPCPPFLRTFSLKKTHHF